MACADGRLSGRLSVKKPILGPTDCEDREAAGGVAFGAVEASTDCNDVGATRCWVEVGMVAAEDLACDWSEVRAAAAAALLRTLIPSAG